MSDLTASGLANVADWRAHFPRGPTDALWFISAASDASMRAAFVDQPAADMATVIGERFEQNRDLKPFVRRVMDYDVLHPIQALHRMQRTAAVMFDCLPPGRRASTGFGRARLNLIYTGLVLLWLLDRSPNDRRTFVVTRLAMRLARL